MEGARGVGRDERLDDGVLSDDLDVVEELGDEDEALGFGVGEGEEVDVVGEADGDAGLVDAADVGEVLCVSAAGRRRCRRRTSG